MQAIRRDNCHDIAAKVTSEF